MNISKPFLILFAVILLAGVSSIAQVQKAPTPNYLTNPTIPSFAFRKVPDSSVFSKKNIQAGKATIFMVFSPECEHCRAELVKLIANIDLFKDVQIIMYAPVKYDTTRKFYQAMNLSKYPQFVMGADPMFSLGSFYQINSLPTLFLYDKKGKFVKRYEGRDITPEQIASDF